MDWGDTEQLRGLYGRVPLGGWHRDGHYKGSVSVLGKFSKPDRGQILLLWLVVSNMPPFPNF